MVGIVVVCHSEKLAEGILHEIRMFAKKCPITIAGGDDNGNYGTSYTKIKQAIDSIYSEDGVCVVVDVGSSIMTAQMVLEELNKNNIKIIDCPIVEGAIIASTSSELGDGIDQIIKKVLSSNTQNKLN